MSSFEPLIKSFTIKPTTPIESSTKPSSLTFFSAQRAILFTLAAFWLILAGIFQSVPCDP